MRFVLLGVVRWRWWVCYSVVGGATIVTVAIDVTSLLVVVNIVVVASYKHLDIGVSWAWWSCMLWFHVMSSRWWCCVGVLLLRKFWSVVCSLLAVPHRCWHKQTESRRMGPNREFATSRLFFFFATLLIDDSAPAATHESLLSRCVAWRCVTLQVFCHRSCL